MNLPVIPWPVEPTECEECGRTLENGDTLCLDCLRELSQERPGRDEEPEPDYREDGICDELSQRDQEDLFP